MYLTGAWELALALVAAVTLRRHWVAGRRERGEEVGLASLRGGDIARAAYPRE
jgi:hypothetical protein